MSVAVEKGENNLQTHIMIILCQKLKKILPGHVDIAKELLKVSSVDLTVKTSGGKTLEQAAR